MQIYFGETVRRLRREKKLTQEQLAAQLNVSFQTISKWERDESYPDITMLPVLAGFFGVRTDDLLGVNKSENERRVQEIIDNFALEAGHHRRWAEQKQVLKAALKEFPGEYRLWVRYLRCMLNTSNVKTAADRRAFLPEIEPIFDNILDNCTNDAIRIEAKQLMCCIYHSIAALDPDNNEKEQAAVERIIAEMPAMRNSREHLSTYLLHPRWGDKTDAACHDAIAELLLLLQAAVRHLSHVNALSAAKVSEKAELRDQLVRDPRMDERMQAIRTMNGIYDAIFPDGDYGTNYRQVIYNWNDLALWDALLGNFNEAFVCMERAIAIACRFDALPRNSVHTSPLLRGKPFDKFTQHNSGSVAGESGMRERQRELLGNRFPWPEEFKADPRFQQLLSFSQEA